MITLLVALILLAATVWNSNNPGRLASCSVVVGVTTLSYWNYHFGIYDGCVDLLGYYPYQMLAPLISLLILYWVKCQLALALMFLYFTQILISLGYLVIEGQGWYIDQEYQLTMWLWFGIQIALMFSQRLTHGVHRSLCGTKLAGVAAEAFMGTKHSVNSISDHTGETKA